jgi:hypothetical protein
MGHTGRVVAAFRESGRVDDGDTVMLVVMVNAAILPLSKTTLAPRTAVYQSLTSAKWAV